MGRVSKHGVWAAMALGAGTVSLLVGAAGVASAAVPAAPASDFYVGSCAGSGTHEPTIQAAIDAASTGQVVYVCPGSYSEALSVNKNITLLGAQHGVDASNAAARTNPAEESVITSPLDSSGRSQGTISYTGSVGGTIDGFTLSGSAEADDNNAEPGIWALYGNGGQAWQWADNVITGNGEGIQFDTVAGTQAYDPAAPRTVIAGNRIANNNLNATDGKSTSGIFNSNGVMNNVTISGNLFSDNGSAGNANGEINTTGAAACSSGSDDAFSHGLVVSGNTAVQDAGFENNFVVLFCTKGASFTGNTVTYTTAADVHADTDFYLGGGNVDATFTDNTLTGGAAKGFSLNGAFYSGGSNVSITHNTISGRLHGVYVSATGYSSYTVAENTITASSGDGIFVDHAAAGGSVNNNSVSGSSHLDCEDNTTGSGTAGTATSWENNLGTTSSPAGLCTLTASPVLPEAGVAVLLPLAGLGLAGAAFVVRRRRQNA